LSELITTKIIFSLDVVTILWYNTTLILKIAMISIYEDVLPIGLFDLLTNAVISDEMPWFYSPNSAYGDLIEDNSLDQGNLYHLAFSTSTLPSPLAPICNYIIQGCLKDKFKHFQVFRARLALQMWKGDNSITHGAHIDCEVPHMVGLLYLNDSDGDTIIYEQEYDWGSQVTAPPKVLTEKLRVSPKANKLVIFEGNHFHASSAPIIHANRYILNFNWIKNNT
jgi:hypothetical protein